MKGKRPNFLLFKVFIILPIQITQADKCFLFPLFIYSMKTTTLHLQCLWIPLGSHENENIVGALQK
jgi:hypothetical protein